MYLDELTIVRQEVGYGQLGLYGSLGYEDKSVRVRDHYYPHALSAHAPSRLGFELAGRFMSFHSLVALNEDLAYNGAAVDFSVLLDGARIAVVRGVSAGQPPRQIVADVTGGQHLELVVETDHLDSCHSVWLDPHVSDTTLANRETLTDCLGRVEMPLPGVPLHAERCIATVVSPGYERHLDNMLGSLYANGQCQDALVVVFAINPDAACQEVADKYRCELVPCTAWEPLTPSVKSVLYSAAQVVDAEQFLCLDADVLILGDLRPLFAALRVCAEDSVLVCRDDYITQSAATLEEALCTFYGGAVGDIAYLLGKESDAEAAYPLVINDGVFAARRAGLLAVDRLLRGMHLPTHEWMHREPFRSTRNQFMFNLALARLRCGVRMDGGYNAFSGMGDVGYGEYAGRTQIVQRGKPVSILHFAGSGRHAYPELQSQYAQVAGPLVCAYHEDGYAAFLAALRAWIGRHGRHVLGWSFYGTGDGCDGRVRDASTFPLLAALHYLVRANGCSRILETGTGRGVSTACLASALAHRSEGRVVTLDTHILEERGDLWKNLPASIQTCIEPRQCASLDGMRAALALGETYQAALLDSVHTGEYVWEEFQLATQLVCEGGLILIHDAQWEGGTVEEGLRSIMAAGYGVTRLWTAREGYAEDNGMGLAVIENRRYTAGG